MSSIRLWHSELAIDNVDSAATTLANDCYIISDFGGNDIEGYMLVGMRVQGNTLCGDPGYIEPNGVSL